MIYHQLEELLFNLGFAPVERKGNHKVYSHSNSEALILLPPYESTDRLRFVHYLVVRRILKEYNILDETTYKNWFS